MPYLSIFTSSVSALPAHYVQMFAVCVVLGVCENVEVCLCVCGVGKSLGRSMSSSGVSSSPGWQSRAEGPSAREGIDSLRGKEGLTVS